MIMEAIFGWLGFLGGLLTAVGDLLLDLKGRGNKKLGRYGFMESAWDTMAAWRFKASILLAAVGVPLYFLGLTSLAMQITNTAFALAFWIVALCTVFAARFRQFHIVCHCGYQRLFVLAAMDDSAYAA